MIAVEDIVDHNSFKAWQDDLPKDRDEASYRALADGLRMRSVARVLPIYWGLTLTSERVRERDLTALPLLRSLLISSVASLAPTDDIRAAAAAADTTARVAADADADARVDFAARTAADAAIWVEIRGDCNAILAGDDIAKRGLWQEGGFPADDPWPDLERRIRGQSDDWDFWVAWYNKLRAGETMPIELLTKIALIEPDTWDKGAEVVNPIIGQMWFDQKNNQSIELFKATLYDFKFDALRGVMLAIPTPKDWETLTDPEALRAFVKDALDLIEDLNLLNQAFAAEGSSMQGAGMVCTYMSQVLDELENAETVGALRVGKLVNWGGFLENAALREDTRREFGVMAGPFSAGVAKLKDLIRDHFAQTLVRFSTLRDLRLEDDALPWQVLADLRNMVDAVRSGVDGTLPPLAAEDIVILDDITNSIDRMIRGLEGVQSEESAESRKQEIDFLIAKVLATIGLYRERAQRVVEPLAKGADGVAVWTKRGKVLRGLLKQIKQYLE